MKTENLKISDIINHANSLLSELVGKKVSMGSHKLTKDTIQFHETVINLLNGYFKKYGLKYTLWSIKKIDDNEVLLNLSIPNFIDDKRIKDNRAGKIIEIYINPFYDFPDVMNMTMEDYCKSIIIKELSSGIEYQKKSIKESENELSLKKLQLEQSEQELSKLLKEHNVN